MTFLSSAEKLQLLSMYDSYLKQLQWLNDNISYSYITYITSFSEKKAGANKSWGGAPLLTTLPGSLLLNLPDTKTRNFLKCENRDKAWRS